MFLREPDFHGCTGYRWRRAGHMLLDNSPQSNGYTASPPHRANADRMGSARFVGSLGTCRTALMSRLDKTWSTAPHQGSELLRAAAMYRAHRHRLCIPEFRNLPVHGFAPRDY